MIKPSIVMNRLPGRGMAGPLFATSAAKAPEIPSGQVWFAAGERIGYDSNARTIIPERAAPLKVFLSREGSPFCAKKIVTREGVTDSGE
jgi:hypothetical protein